ncbi:MAG: hypothetical protein R2883_05100 [Caldisericia bacterium]
MRIKVLELCSYGSTGDFEAIDFDGEKIDLNHVPDGWEYKGGNHEAKKFTKGSWTIEVYVEGRIILLDIPTKNGREISKSLLLSWPRL